MKAHPNVAAAYQAVADCLRGTDASEAATLYQSLANDATTAAAALPEREATPLTPISSSGPPPYSRILTLIVAAFSS